MKVARTWNAGWIPLVARWVAAGLWPANRPARNGRRIGSAALLLLLACTCGRAQILDPSSPLDPLPGDPDFDATTDQLAGPQQQRAAIVDTFGIFTYRVDNPNAETAWRDSLLDQFQRYEPDRTVPFDWATTGQPGGAAYPLRYTPVRRQGTEIGLRQFDLYQVDGRSLDFYRLQYPFTYLNYVRESEQEDYLITAKFSRNFADGVNLNIDYTRLSQQGNRDQYPGQNLRNTHVATGLSVRPQGSRYQGFFSFAANTYEQLQNGGIVDSSFANNDRGEVVELANLTPLLEETRLRYSYRQLMATQSLQFGGGPAGDTDRERRAFTLTHRLRLDNRRHRLSSSISPQDQNNFFRRFPDLLLDTRGLRNQIEQNILENDLSFSTFRRSTSTEKAIVQKDVIEAGLTHLLHRIRQDNDSTVNNVLAHARLGFRPSDRLSLLVAGQLNLVGQTGDYRIEGEGTLDLGAAGKLEFKALNQLYAPDLVQQIYRLNGETLWNNRFGKTLEVRLEGAYTLPLVKIRAGVGYSLLTNYVYFDQNGQPVQSDGPHSLLQLTAERNFRFGKWNIHNRLLLQEADAEVFRLPQLYGEHSLYFSGKWFGVLNVNLGFDVRYSSDFTPYYYNPVVQQFQLQDEQRTGFQLQVDPFFSMRVTRFRVFAKFIQLNTLWAPDQLFYLTADHPNPDGALRWGVSWRLLD